MILYGCVLFYIIGIINVFCKLSLNSLEFMLYGDSGNIIIKEHDDKLLIASESREIMSFSPESIEFLSQLTYKKLFSTDCLTSNKVKQWILYSFDTFQNNESQLWTPNITSQCGNSGDIFLGGFCKLAHGEAIRYYNSLPQHTLIRFTARVHFFDKWMGESISFSINNNVVWTDSYKWCEEFSMNCKTEGIDICGQQYPDRMSVSLDVTIPNSEDSLMISFSSTLNEETNPCEVSWGIDDIALYLM